MIGDEADVLEADSQNEADEADAPERAVRCAACRHVLTTRAARIRVRGAHAHTFKNPAAIDFLIGCYGSAPGCRGMGETSSVWTWFPGFSWQIALCGSCVEHVGWLFARADTEKRFVALILDRILED